MVTMRTEIITCETQNRDFYYCKAREVALGVKGYIASSDVQCFPQKKIIAGRSDIV